MTQPASLLSKTSASVSGINVTHNKKPLDDPYVTTIYLTNTGARDITSDTFDKDRPVQIELEAPIIEIIDVSALPESFALPAHSSQKTSIDIGPDLLRRKHRIQIQILTDGRPNLSCKSPLADTEIHVENEESRTYPGYRRNLLPPRLASIPIVGAPLVGLAFVIPILTEFITSNPDYPSTPPHLIASPLSGSKVNVAGKEFAEGKDIRLIFNCLAYKESKTIKINNNGGFSITLPTSNTRLISGSQCAVIALQQVPPRDYFHAEEAGMLVATLQVPIT